MRARQPPVILKHYTAVEAARVAGISTDMLNYLCRCTLIAPSGNASRGRGQKRQFLYQDLILLRVIAHLLTKGISVLRLRKSLAALQNPRGSMPDLLTKRYVATDGVDLYVSDNGVWRAISSGQFAFAFVLQLQDVRREVLNRASLFASASPGRRKTAVA